ncbi:putative HNHc nuclease [Periweissella ghanensis]|uniref:Phage protein n=1 Tax=Periweissella ghanensis TaxID=467997 RepID=A0ABM8ZCJ4_9LACO|nr:putative HNHc nuclease [Periweissella ghanensis]MCM0600340.1 hypothetical protein [Periweissella ghanensis]CAH0419256.1 hypothetical protein WGH24286_01703 [Periweissella ghanensis]
MINSFGAIEEITGQTIKVRINDEVDLSKLRKFANGKQPIVRVELDDGRGASMEQIKKTHALANEFGEYTGYFKDAIEVMKYLYSAETGESPEFSFETVSMSAGARFIDWQINYMLDNEIPFKTKIWDEIKGDYRWQKKALKKRLCVICGTEHADVAHFVALGSGMNRVKVDPSKYMYMSLCRKHHGEQHAIGIVTFCQKYIIKPIKLEPDEIKEFRIQGRLSNES